MGRKAQIEVKESASELRKLQLQQKSFKKEKRVLALLKIKQGKAGTRANLANFLGVGLRTLETWLTIYSREGLEKLLEVKPRRKRSKLITPEIHEALKERVNDKSNPFLGYLEAKQWIQDEYGVNITYHWLRKYMISRFGTKLKAPRKSHIKTDKQA